MDYIEIVGFGSLVFNRGHSITIRTKGIFVKENGKLVIGSESCRHSDNVLIVLEGKSLNRFLVIQMLIFFSIRMIQNASF